MSHARLSLAFTVVCLVASAMATVALAETPLQNGLTIELQPGYSHQKLRGIDSLVGKLVNPDGLTIGYEIGDVVQPGGLRFGGNYSNYAQGMDPAQRAWLKEQVVAGRKFSVAYGKEQRLVVSTEFDKVGINFSTTAKTPEEVATVLLMTLSVTQAK